MKKNGLARHGEIIFLSVLMILGVYIFYQTFFLPPSYYQLLGAAAYPRLIVALLAILCLVVLAQKNKAKPSTAPAGIEPSRPSGARPPLLASALLVVAYGLGFTFLGYFVSSFIFIVLLVYVLSGYLPKVIPKAILISAAVTGFMYLFLMQFLNLYFPQAWLF